MTHLVLGTPLDLEVEENLHYRIRETKGGKLLTVNGQPCVLFSKRGEILYGQYPKETGKAVCILLNKKLVGTLRPPLFLPAHSQIKVSTVGHSYFIEVETPT